jgi:hypothetical protein
MFTPSSLFFSTKHNKEITIRNRKHSRDITRSSLVDDIEPSHTATGDEIGDGDHHAQLYERNRTHVNYY